jgi:hypothetical protein
MTIARLPEGARLALINWPGGQPTWQQIVEAAGPTRHGHSRNFRWCVRPLLNAGLLTELKRFDDAGMLTWRTFRLTQAGRKAVDVLQSGVE